MTSSTMFDSLQQRLCNLEAQMRCLDQSTQMDEACKAEYMKQTIQIFSRECEIYLNYQMVKEIND